MGLLSQGTPLAWADARVYADHVRKHGILQFINTYHRCKGTGRKGVLFWGDEVEYLLVEFDEKNRNAMLSLRGFDVLTELMLEEENGIKNGVGLASTSVPILWRPEYGKFMLEGTPGAPYSLKASDLPKVEKNMKLRRQTAQKLLNPDEFLATVTSFPRLGALDAPFTAPHIDMNDAPEIGHGGHHVDTTQSLFIPDEVINPHPRFRTLTTNIRERRTQKVSINMPIFKDIHTPSPFIEALPASPYYQNPYETGEALADHIYMDAMAFGMGCCCLQLTLQASHIHEARRLYDQLSVLSPILMALSAASPIYRGYLADVDTRWNVISGSVDDRSPTERGQIPPRSFSLPRWDSELQLIVEQQKIPRRIYKSRYDSVSTYLAQQDIHFDASYNDIELVVDTQIQEQLLHSGVDALLARHIAHLFIRDPLVLFRELLDQDDTRSNDHFENLQSTNWQTMRFKPPSLAAPDLGWRVEFRSMEVQLTDFENAAFAIFVVLLSRVILCLDLNLYIPISKVDENMHTAHKRDAVLTQKFWFRRNVLDSLILGKTPIRSRSCSPLVSSHTDTTTTAAPVASSANHVHASLSMPVNAGNSPNTAHVLANPFIGSPTTTIEVPITDNADPNLCGCATFASPSKNQLNHRRTPPLQSSDPEWSEMTIDEIINGRVNYFPGLVPLVQDFLDTIVVEPQVRELVGQYLNFIRGLANGTIATTANWMRQFVRNHPQYQAKMDSKVSPEVAFDLLKMCQKISDSGVPVHATPVL